MPIEPASAAAWSLSMSPNRFSVSRRRSGAVRWRDASRTRRRTCARAARPGSRVATSVDRLAPELRRFEHVGLVDRRDEAAALPRLLERDAGDADDLVARVAHRVERFVCAPSARLAEVQAAEQLADDQARPRRATLSARYGVASISAGSVRAGRRLAKPPSAVRSCSNADFRTLVGRQSIERRIADRAEQHRVAVEAGVAASVGQRRAVLVERRAANRVFLAVELVPERVGNESRTRDGLRRDFGTDAVARQHRDRQTHGLSSWRTRLIGGHRFDDVDVLDGLDGIGGRDQPRVDAGQRIGPEAEAERAAARIDAARSRMFAEHEPRAGRAHRLRAAGSRRSAGSSARRPDGCRPRARRRWRRRWPCWAAPARRRFRSACGSWRRVRRCGCWCRYGSRSRRTCSAITISSSDALPARSPMPLIVHSTWRAPACTAAIEFADRHAEVVVAVRRQDDVVPIALADGREHARDVRRAARSRPCRAGSPSSRPAQTTASATSHRNARSLRVASSAENSTSSTYCRASATASAACSRQRARSMRSLSRRCRSEVARNTWMRGRAAALDRGRRALDVGASRARARPAMIGPPNLSRYRADRREIAVRGNRESGLDDVHARADRAAAPAAAFRWPSC